MQIYSYVLFKYFWGLKAMLTPSQTFRRGNGPVPPPGSASGLGTDPKSFMHASSLLMPDNKSICLISNGRQ